MIQLIDEDIGVRVLVDAVIHEHTVCEVEVRDAAGHWTPFFKLCWADLVEGRISAATLGCDPNERSKMVRAVAMAAARDARSRIAADYDGGRR